jgi:nucleoside-diphosphate-sugar epimerase
MEKEWRLTGKTVLVTGATGYVGRHLVAHLAPANQVFALQRHLPAAGQKVPGVRYLRGDVAEAGRIRLPVRPDIIIHQAALLDNPIVGPEPPNSALFDTNVRGTQRLLDRALELGVPRFVYGSTTGFYGLGPDPFPENAPLDPVNFYHLSKAMCEQMCRWYGKRMTMVTLRYSAPYGPGTSNPLLKHLLGELAAGREVSCAEDGAPRINPVYIDDAVAITERACFLEGCHAINVGGPDVVSQIDLIQGMARALGVEARVKLRPGGGRLDLIVDVSAVKRLLGYDFTVRFEEGVRRMAGGAA